MHSLIRPKLLGVIFSCFCLVAAGFYFFSHSPFKEEELSPREELIASSKKSPVQFFRIPLYFEKNEGQIDPGVKYLAKGRGYSFYFTPQEIVMELGKGSKEGSRGTSSVLKLQFVGARQDPGILGIDEQLCKSNYFIGNDPAKWRTDISNFARVQYEELYPGINALFYGNNEQLEYDLCLAPQADAQMARLRIEGAQSLRIDHDDNLCIQMEDGEEVQMKKPIVYQTFSGRKVSVNGDFVLLASNEVGFSLGDYDKSTKLVIDPVLVYSSYLGGSSEDSGLGIAVDSVGNTYVTGSTSSINFPTKNAFQTNLAGSSNAFISRFDTTLSGSASLTYSTYLGGSADDSGSDIAVDSAGNAYVSGYTASTNFPTRNAFQPALAGSYDAFVAVINSSGNALIYSTYLGGSLNDYGFGIDVDSAGIAYVTGATFSTNFPVTAGAFQTALSGVGDAFIARIDPALSGSASLLYSTYLGGSLGDVGNRIAVDSVGNAYITGYTFSPDFPTKNAFQTTNAGIANSSTNAFIAKLNPALSGTASLLYSSYLGGSGRASPSSGDSGNGIAVDSAGNAYITGSTASTNFPTRNAFQTTNAGGFDAFVARFDPALSGSASLVYSSYLGGSLNDSGFDIAVDFAGNAYITGNTASTNFPTVHAFQTALAGPTDAFVAKIDSTPSLAYSSYLGGSSFDSGNGIAVDSTGNAYVTGDTGSTNFPTVNAYQNANAGSSDAFIAKLAIIIPTVTGISPTCGLTSGGTLVTITGTNLTGATAVHFGAVAASSFTIVDDNQITATSPAQGAGTVDVTVSNPDFTSSTSTIDQFTYVSFPGVSGLSPSSVCQAEGTSVIITGLGFTGATVVNFGPTHAPSFTVNSDSQITAIAPPGTGIVNVTVTTRCGGTSATSIADQFTYLQNTSVILAAPNSAALHQPVTLTASVTPSSTTGSVAFFDGTADIGTAPLVNGKATLVAFFNTLGTHTLTAVYSGDSTYCPSTSAAVALEVITALPPAHLKGFQTFKIFDMQIGIVNILKWRAPKKGTSIVFYKIYRDKHLRKLIGKVPNHKKHLRFKDFHCKAGKIYTYYVVSVDEFGNVSSLAKVTVRPLTMSDSHSCSRS